VNKTAEINIRDIFLPPNIVSLSRILLTPFIGYFLWLGSDRATFACVFLLGLAGLSDVIDGFLARRLNQITRLGLMLDPLADKILTVILIIELILFRDFPIWLAVLIFARDIAIMVLGIGMAKRKGAVPGSNLAGKYYFLSVFFLLVGYILRFDFGKQLLMYITIIMYVLSSLSYGRLYQQISKNKQPAIPRNRSVYKAAGLILAAVVGALYFYRLYFDVLIDLFKVVVLKE
jgi:cardiolipin synthase